MLDGLGANADSIFATERLAAEFEQNAGKLWLFGGRHKTGSARGIAETSTSRRAIRQTKAADVIIKYPAFWKCRWTAFVQPGRRMSAHEKN
jgi:hypothetical protein